MAITESEEQKAARAKRDADFQGQVIHKEHIPVDEDKLHKMSGVPDDYVDMESWLSDKAQKVLDELSDKYKNMDFFAGSPNKVKGLMAKSSTYVANLHFKEQGQTFSEKLKRVLKADAGC